MANIALITLVLAMFYSMATAGSWKEMLGKPVCEYQKTEKDWNAIGYCLTKHGYPVKEPCDEEQVQAAHVDGTKWPLIFICIWKETKQIKEDGTCDIDIQNDAIATRVTFENPQTETTLRAAIDQCNEDNKDDCISALFCAFDQSWKICYPDAKFHRKNNTEVSTSQ